MTTICGLLERITYHDKENDFVISAMVKITTGTVKITTGTVKITTGTARYYTDKGKA